MATWGAHLWGFAIGIVLIFIGISQLINIFTIPQIPSDTIFNIVYIVGGIIIASKFRA